MRTSLSIMLVVVAGVALAGWWYVSRPVTATPASGMTCDMGISAARAGRGAAAASAQATSAGIPSAQQTSRSPAPISAVAPPAAPEGMVWIPGGEFWMGADEFPDAQPWHRVSVNGFWIDETEVTNAQFDEFVKATGYVTVAERVPRAENYPGAKPDMLFAGSVVFSPPDHAVSLHDHFQWWGYVRGANWRHPEGDGSSIEKRMGSPGRAHRL